MSFSTRAAGIAVAVAGVLAAASPAEAAVVLNDQPLGLRALNNVSILPIQLCGQASSCENAPVGDHLSELITNSVVRGKGKP
ncbi:hypothetical protein NLX83_34505 [Allokutzneria sp. A3M-2-11 16]|uniref:hypothetical protein n=1 Tax=Allokutzneria sp. A3M-2-11 16 TaxID=2962043 RepID=UPI0020B7EF11|nr:hypothetical protein [Allokutzneria sp. A3M-2-11 16]MCP3804392.1 hypothetical protein [Allokutzneria sp. A3M-2-11 16]